MTAWQLRERIDEVLGWLVDYAGFGTMSDRRLAKLANALHHLEALRHVLRLTPVAGTEVSAWDLMEDEDMLRLGGGRRARDDKAGIIETMLKSVSISEAMKMTLQQTEVVVKEWES